MAAVGPEVAARNVRPRQEPWVASPQDAFLELWRPRVQAQFEIYNSQHVLTSALVMPYADNALDMVSRALTTMVEVATAASTSKGTHRASVTASVALSLPELGVDSQMMLEVHYAYIPLVHPVIGRRWFARSVRADEAPQPWRELGSGLRFAPSKAVSEAVLAALRVEGRDLLLDVRNRREEAARALAEQLPSDVLQFELGPFISYKKTRELPRRRLSRVSTHATRTR